VAELATAARAHGVLVHSDATQAVGKIPVDLGELGVDLLTAGGHKFGAGLGMGLLVVRGNLPLPPLLGGQQERGFRGGTENVAAIAAAAAALEAVLADLERSTPRIAGLRDRLESELVARIPGTKVYGGQTRRLPNTTLTGFAGAPGEAVLIALDLAGIAASSGAACASGSLEPSHALLAMGVSKAEARTAIRFSLGAMTSAAEVERVVEVLPAIVEATRERPLA
jgi:cysteine desulfurase